MRSVFINIYSNSEYVLLLMFTLQAGEVTRIQCGQLYTVPEYPAVDLTKFRFSVHCPLRDVFLFELKITHLQELVLLLGPFLFLPLLLTL